MFSDKQNNKMDVLLCEASHEFVNIASLGISVICYKCSWFFIMAILNKNNQKVLVRYFVLFMSWKAWNIEPNCPSYI